MTASKISVAPWAPELIRDLVWELEQTDLADGQRATLDRMASDPRMEHVWRLLLSRDRQSGEFAYPALRRDDRPLLVGDGLQFSAIREIFFFVFTARRDEMKASKIEEVFQNKTYLLENVARLRTLADDLDLARTREMFGMVDANSKALAGQDIEALRHVANWLEHLTSAMRGPDDPLIVQKHRGDPLERGIKILTATKLKELFGERLDGTAATLTSVALGIKTSSARASRSALSKLKPVEKADASRR
jgi:hypothetical protein